MICMVANVHASVCPSVYSYLCLSVYLSMYLCYSVCLYLCFSPCPCLCLCCQHNRCGGCRGVDPLQWGIRWQMRATLPQEPPTPQPRPCRGQTSCAMPLLGTLPCSLVETSLSLSLRYSPAETGYGKLDCEEERGIWGAPGYRGERTGVLELRAVLQFLCLWT